LRRVAVDHDQIEALGRRHHIRRLALFGSVLRDDFQPESDVDMLVEFEPGQTAELEFFTIQDELARLLDRRVDLNTPACLSPYFRAEVLAVAEMIYEQA
jgi:uncharacterized protein